MTTTTPPSHPPAPLGLGPRRDSGLSSSFGLWLAGLVDAATAAGTSPAARDRARLALREAARLSTRAGEVVRARIRTEEAARVQAKRVGAMVAAAGRS